MFGDERAKALVEQRFAGTNTVGTARASARSAGDGFAPSTSRVNAASDDSERADGNGPRRCSESGVGTVSSNDCAANHALRSPVRSCTL
ncbi:MAG TPA: hypothetical protein VF103_06930 [Polyangiaceae bacterium]